MWDQKDCVGYLKTAAVLASYVDQSISTNTFYNPAHFENRKVPTTLIATNLMLAHKWGIKTFYYSLINKAGSKAETVNGIEFNENAGIPTANGHVNGFDPMELEDDCEACKL
jgi:ribonucleoside-diphosphate reductase alpha chain